jgi:hypothetical protein
MHPRCALSVLGVIAGCHSPDGTAPTVVSAADPQPVPQQPAVALTSQMREDDPRPPAERAPDAGSCADVRKRVRELVRHGKTTCATDDECGTYGSWLDVHPCGDGSIDRDTARQLSSLGDASRVSGCAHAVCNITPYLFRPYCHAGCSTR